MLVQHVGKLLTEIARRGVAVLLVEQKLTIALQPSRRVYVMGHGRVVFECISNASHGSGSPSWVVLPMKMISPAH